AVACQGCISFCATATTAAAGARVVDARNRDFECGIHRTTGATGVFTYYLTACRCLSREGLRADAGAEECRCDRHTCDSRRAYEMDLRRRIPHHGRPGFGRC